MSTITTTYSEGRYTAAVLEQGFEKSSIQGTPGFYLRLKILKRYDANGQLVECPQFERDYIQWLANETSLRILRGDLKALDVQFKELTQLDPATPDHIGLVGRTIEVTCKLETYNGRQRERWGIARVRKKLDSGAVRALDVRLRDGNTADNSSPPVPPPSDNNTPS